MKLSFICIIHCMVFHFWQINGVIKSSACMHIHVYISWYMRTYRLYCMQNVQHLVTISILSFGCSKAIASRQLCRPRKQQWWTVSPCSQRSTFLTLHPVPLPRRSGWQSGLLALASSWRAPTQGMLSATREIQPRTNFTTCSNCSWTDCYQV